MTANKVRLFLSSIPLPIVYAICGYCKTPAMFAELDEIERLATIGEEVESAFCLGKTQTKE